MPAVPAVLIVEDSPILQKTLGFLFHHWRYTMHAVATIPEALSYLRLLQWDVVLLDWNLRATNGTQALAAFKQLPQVPPIIVMSGDPDYALALGAAPLPVAGVLFKPFEPEELRDTIAAALQS